MTGYDHKALCYQIDIIPRKNEQLAPFRALDSAEGIHFRGITGGDDKLSR